jgi:hypothetical protein
MLCVTLLVFLLEGQVPLSVCTTQTVRHCFTSENVVLVVPRAAEPAMSASSGDVWFRRVLPSTATEWLVVEAGIG